MRERCLPDYLNNTFTYPQGYFSDFKNDFFLEKVFLFAHYHGIIYSSRDGNFSNKYGNFGVLYFEHVDRTFLLYKFYLEIFCRKIFNNAIKKILPYFYLKLIAKQVVSVEKRVIVIISTV